MYQQRIGARAAYRISEAERVKGSATLAQQFQKLKSLTVHLSFFGAEANGKSSQELKYSVNLANAKSVFRFSCPNDECIGGDFDLSKELSRAVAARTKIVNGEMTCEGWRSRTTINTVHCHNILRYKLTLGY